MAVAADALTREEAVAARAREEEAAARAREEAASARAGAIVPVCYLSL
jgi:hypothetical protein